MDLYKLNHLRMRDLQNLSNTLQLFINDGVQDLSTVMTVFDRVINERSLEYRKQVRVEEKKKPKKRPGKKIIACPDCGSEMRVLPVNVSRCTNIGGGWRSALECSVCLNSIYSKFYPSEIIKDGKY